MDTRIRYAICPVCGFQNTETKSACPACDARLFSDDQEEHQRYLELVRSQHRNQSFQWAAGWIVIGFVVFVPFLLFLGGVAVISAPLPIATVLVGAMVLGWRLIDLRKKRNATGRFLSKYGNG